MECERGRVDVWLTPSGVASDDLQNVYQRLLDPLEYERWQRILVQGARDQYLVARALVRTTLSRYSRVAANNWVFKTNAYGRPYIAYPTEYRGIFFNLSHTEGLVVCAVSNRYDVGIDVENTDRDLDLLELANFSFAPLEIARLMVAPPEERQRRFFAYWTLKEAYIKARGIGLSIPLDAFWFDLDGPSPRIHFTDRCHDRAERWRFGEFTPTEIHTIALAVSLPEGETPDIRLRWTVPFPEGT